jgi:hypothetical protein
LWGSRTEADSSAALRNDKQGKGQYRDSGFARMTSEKDKSRFPTGMTNKRGDDRDSEPSAQNDGQKGHKQIPSLRYGMTKKSKANTEILASPE